MASTALRASAFRRAVPTAPAATRSCVEGAAVALRPAHRVCQLNCSARANSSLKEVIYTLNQPLRYSTTIFQRFGFSSSTPQDQETTAQEIKAETSKEDSGSSGGAEDLDLSKEDLVKLVLEKDELLTSKDEEVKDMKDKVLRSYAEMENAIARTKRESENSKKFAVQNFSKSLLDVADNLARASSAVKESFSKLDTSEDSSGAVPLLKTLLEGVDMTDKQLAEVFKKFGVEKFDPLNEKFDPERHYAIFQMPDTSKPPGTVTAVVKMYEIVNLADALLPPLPAGLISLPAHSHVFMKGSSVRRPASSKQGESGSIDIAVSGREKLLRDQPELLQQFGMDVLPTMTQVYGSSVNGSVRHKCLSVIAKLMYYSSAEMIEILLGTTNISSFLAGILSWKDPQVLIPALQIAEILMEKLPGTFSKMFVREGVVHAVESLICLEISSPMLSQVSPREKDIDSGTCTSSRSRRSRRRSSTVNTDNNSLDEPKGSNPVIANSPPSTLEGPNTSLRASVSDHAKSFKDKYFPSDPNSTDIAVTDDLLKLRSLCTKLNTTVDTVKTKAKGKSKSPGGDDFDVLCSVEEQLDNIIAEILSELSRGDGVSTFEFIGSGIIAALLTYLSCGTFEREKVSEANLPKLRQQALRRYKSFIYVALPNDAIGNKTPMSFLVQKLQSALSSLERFPVVLSHSGRTSSSGGSRPSSGLSALSQPLKLRLCRAHGEKTLKDYSSNIVLIDPLASLAAVEDFLWPRIQRTESVSYPGVSSGKNSESVAPSATTPVPLSTQSVRRPSTRSKSLATVDCAAKKDTQEGSRNTSKGKGKAVVKSPPDEPKGPHTRTAARRKVASEKDAEVKPPDDQSSSEVLPGSLPVCVPENVHDVKLADADESSIASVANDNQTQLSSSSSIRDTFSSRGAGSAELRKPSSRGAMSFAAAAMAGLASVGSHGIRGSRDRRGLSLGASAHERSKKLVFTTGGKQLSKHLTVYQAMQHQVVHDEDDEESLGGADLPNDDGSHFWGDIFTITYQKADNEVDKGSVRGSASVLKSSNSDSCRATSEALNRLQQQQGDNSSATEREVRVGRLQRQKVRVSRNRILDSAAKVMEMFSTQKAVLEVEYFGEVGTGLGPTLEFYTLLSHDLQRVGLGLWRSDSPHGSDTLEAKKLDSNSPGGARNLIQEPLGLFPRPWPPSTAASSEGSKFFKVIEYFRLVGRVMAKALQDGRLLDLPLSTTFYKLILGQELDLYDILSFDAEFGKILQELQILVERKRFLESCSSSNQQIEDLCFRGASVEDLCLEFTLPGYPDYVLKEGKENTVVSIYNLEEYISLVVDATVKAGIMRQVDAFKTGFNQVFDISSLQIFSPQELDYLICGRRELWEPETLVEHIKFDHGYTSKSPAIVNLLEIMTEFTPEQQHAFCQFVTSAPRLPPGGLSALNPKLTIVRKHSSTAANTSNAAGAMETADDDLPSVMTCANYLKLPPYSTKEVMHKKLLYAINEGQGSFDLS
ncbi:hypothetical protein ACQ4PT_051008 [Festuca glaucescens]